MVSSTVGATRYALLAEWRNRLSAFPLLSLRWWRHCRNPFVSCPQVSKFGENVIWERSILSPRAPRDRFFLSTLPASSLLHQRVPRDSWPCIARCAASAAQQVDSDGATTALIILFCAVLIFVGSLIASSWTMNTKLAYCLLTTYAAYVIYTITVEATK